MLSISFTLQHPNISLGLMPGAEDLLRVYTNSSYTGGVSLIEQRSQHKQIISWTPKIREEFVLFRVQLYGHNTSNKMNMHLKKYIYIKKCEILLQAACFHKTDFML